MSNHEEDAIKETLSKLLEDLDFNLGITLEPHFGNYELLLFKDEIMVKFIMDRGFIDCELRNVRSNSWCLYVSLCNFLNLEIPQRFSESLETMRSFCNSIQQNEEIITKHLAGKKYKKTEKLLTMHSILEEEKIINRLIGPGNEKKLRLTN